jgi:cell division septation protein DedD
MDEHNKDDEKRRIMTPPPEWGGDSESPETDWLGDTPPEATTNPDPNPPSALDNEADWLGGHNADTTPQGTANSPRSSGKAVFTLPDDDAHDSGWLGNPEDKSSNITGAEPSSAEDISISELPDAPWDGDDVGGTQTELEGDVSTAVDEPPLADDSVTSTTGLSAERQTDDAVRVRRVASKGREVDPQAAAAESLLTDHRAVESQNRRLPLWPFVTVTAAAILLIVGGWGAVQERNELQQEIAQLKGQLGQKRSDGDLSSAQEASLLAENESMKAQLATLRDEYAQLANEISSLQNRLMADVDAGENQARVAATAETAAGPAATEVTTPAPAATSEPAYEATENETDLSEDSEQDIVALTGTTWFVNVASHSNRELAATWRDRIAKRYEGVRIQEADVNGRSLFRVRVLGFSSKAAAERARRQLEQDFGIGPLWVGSMTETTNDVTEVKTAVPATLDASPKEPKLEPAIASIAAPTSKVEAPQVSGDTAPPSATQQALELQPINSDGGWFIYVDTFSQPAAADERAKQITAAGYDAKVAVEYRTGEMFYRVQVVGIKSRMQGEAVVAKLASLDDMPNLQLRQY